MEYVVVGIVIEATYKISHTERLFTGNLHDCQDFINDLKGQISRDRLVADEAWNEMLKAVPLHKYNYYEFFIV